MAIEVELPDGTVVEFPDGTDNATMERALAQYKQPTALGEATRGVARPNAADDFTSTLQFATPFGTLDSGVEMPGWLSRGLAGAGRSFVNTAEGIGQLRGTVSQQQVDDRRRLDADLMGTTGGVVGNIGGDVAQLFVPGGAIAKGARAFGVARSAIPFAAAATEGAAFAGLQPVASGESRGGNMAFGGAFGVAGQGIASALGRAANGVIQNPAVREAIGTARDRFGVNLSLRQALDTPFLNTVGSALDKLPLSGAHGAAMAQRADFNRAVSNTFGENAGAITPDVYAAAKARIGQVFETLSARNELPLGPDLMDRLSGVLKEAQDFGDPATSRAVQSALDRVIAQSQNGVLPGRAYQSLDSSLGQIMKNGGEKAHYFGQVRDALREAMDGAISLGDQAAWQGARQEWRSLKTVRDLVAKADESGISPRSLLGRVTASGAGKEAAASGRAGQLGDLALLGQRLADKSPDSGTAQRVLTYSTLGLGGLGSQSENPYVSGLGNLALAAAAGGMGGRMLNSPSVARALVAERPVLQGIARQIEPMNALMPAHRTAIAAGGSVMGGEPIEITGGRVGTPAELAAQDEELAALQERARRRRAELDAMGVAY